jgi:phosphoglucomutase/phosphomannomutase
MVDFPHNFDTQTKENILDWLEGPFPAAIKDNILKQLANHPHKVQDAFYSRLAFGTGGVRALMGIGSNRLNIYTIQLITQGLVNFLFKTFPNTQLKVFISFDSRNHSNEFAKMTAQVFAANHVDVFITKELRPTPFVSFGIRENKCHAGVMITASHNPKEYNGYKVYFQDGAQLVPPYDQQVVDEINAIASLGAVKTEIKDHSLIHEVTDELDLLYLKQTQDLQLNKKTNEKEGHLLKVLYSPIHGAGITLVPKLLKNWGFTQFDTVFEQSTPDGNFPTAEKPNPESKKTLEIGKDRMLKDQFDLFIATDPDADRIGVVINHHGQSVFLNGNEMASIFLEAILSSYQARDLLNYTSCCIKSIVTTELFKAICDHYKVECMEVLTGFKYIGEKINQFEKNQDHQFIFGAEESYGCLYGTHVRDKDAILATGLVCDIALQLKLQNKTLFDLLHEIYAKHGVYREHLETIEFAPGKQGHDEILNLLKKLRACHPKHLGHKKILAIEDYLTQQKFTVDTQESVPLLLPASNVILYRLENAGKVVVRASGTEPKLKIYLGIKAKQQGSIEDQIKKADITLQALSKSLKAYLNT